MYGGVRGCEGVQGVIQPTCGECWPAVWPSCLSRQLGGMWSARATAQDSAGRGKGHAGLTPPEARRAVLVGREGPAGGGGGQGGGGAREVVWGGGGRVARQVVVAGREGGQAEDGGRVARQVRRELW